MRVPPTDPKKASDAARDPATTANDLRGLARSEYGFVRESVARHRNTDPEILSSLVPQDLKSDANRSIAGALAHNEATPAEALSSLLLLLDLEQLDGARRENWPFEHLAAALLDHPELPEESATSVLSFPHLSKRIKLAVIESGRSRRMLLHLANDPSSVVSDAARRQLSAA
jgi:hypothetical protein